MSIISKTFLRRSWRKSKGNIEVRYYNLKCNMEFQGIS